MGKATGSRECAPDDRLRVPTILDIRMLDGGHAALCPPYAASNPPHHAGLAGIAFQRVAIPLRCDRRSLIGALQESQ